MPQNVPYPHAGNPDVNPAKKIYEETINTLVSGGKVDPDTYKNMSKGDKDALRRRFVQLGTAGLQSELGPPTNPFETILNKLAKVEIEDDPLVIRSGAAQQSLGVAPSQMGATEYIQTTLNIEGQRLNPLSAVADLEKMGFAGEGLENLFTVLQQKAGDDFGIDLSKGSLVISQRDMNRPIHIPLFGKSLDVGREGVKTFQELSDMGVGGLLMFQKGSAYTSVPDIGTLKNSGLTNVRSFNAHFYEELVKVIEKSNILNADLEKQVRFLLNRQQAYMPGLDRALGGKVTDSVEFSDSLQYSGKNILTRHQLGFANQMLVEVPKGTQLFDLLKEEAQLRREFQTNNRTRGQDVERLITSHDKAKQAVLDHLKNIESQGTPREKELVKRLNLMFASQSAEWIFNNAIVDNLTQGGGEDRTFIKLTSASIKDLSILPAQDIYEKGRQFYLSAAPVKIDNVYELPGSVANIMRHTAPPEITNVIRGIKENVKALGGGTRDIGLGTRAIGVSFFDQRLNDAFFGDASAMISEELAKRLDRDPTSGRGRTTGTVSIPLNAVDENNFQAFLSTELYEAIKQNKDRKNVTGTINFETPFALFKHFELQGEKLIADGQAALSVNSEGKIQLGQNSIQATKIKERDQRHANDVLRSIKNRGINPLDAQVTGVRINSSTGEMQLIINDGSKVRMDSGYIFEGQRFSAQNIITDDQSREILRTLGLSGKFDAERIGLVMGDLGMTRSTKRPSHGFNVTLLNNLAQSIRKHHDAEDAAKILTNKFGGSFNFVEMESGDITRQFSGLGTKFNQRIDDIVFAKNFEQVLDQLRLRHSDIVDEFKKSTFVTVDPVELLGHTKSFEKLMDDVPDSQQLTEQQKLLRALGLGDVAADLRSTAIVSYGSQVMIREEEPLAKIGTNTAKIRVRELMLLSESMDMALHGRLGMTDLQLSDRNAGRNKAKKIKRMRNRLAKDFIRSNQGLFMPGHEMGIIYQLHQMGKAAGELQQPILEKGSKFNAILAHLANEEIGTVKRVSSRDFKKLGSSGHAGQTMSMPGKDQIVEDIEVLNERNMTVREKKELRRGIDTERRLVSKVRQGQLTRVIDKASVGSGKVSIGQLEETVMGLVKENAQGSVAVISDEVMLVQGPNGPMLIPSAKTMGFRSEKGFVRISDYVNKDYKELEEAIGDSIQNAESTTEKAKAYYLKILQDVEAMELDRLKRGGDSEVVKERAGDIETRLNKLYGYLAQNSLSKAGTFYNAELSSKYVDFAGRFRLQTAPGLEVFEVGLTEGALRKMADGGRYGQQEALQTKGFGIDGVIDKIRNGEDFFLNVYREPIAGGRQMMAMKIKLMDDYLEGTDEFNFDHSAFLHKSMVKYGMDGDFDKDSVSIFRLNSMAEGAMKGIYEGQKQLLGDVLDGLKGADKTLLEEAFGTSNIGIQEVNSLIEQLSDPTSNLAKESASVTTDTLRISSFDAMMKISAHGHATPLIESFLGGRSYLDHMIGLSMDMAQEQSSKRVLIDNIASSLSSEKGHQFEEFMRQASSLFIRDDATGISRMATYNYTDARNLVKYMFLKKAAHGDSKDLGIEIADLLIKHVDMFKDNIGEQDAMVKQIVGSGENIHGETRRMIDELSDKLLTAAQADLPLSEADPQTASLLNRFSGQPIDEAKKSATILAKQMLFTNAISGLFLTDPSQNIPGEQMFKNYVTAMARVGNAAELSGVSGAISRSMIQAMTMDEGFIEEFVDDPLTVERVHQDIKEAKRAALVVSEQDAASDTVGGARGVGGASTSKGAYTNALISGEFFQKFSQSRFFKPAAFIAGGLAAVETIRASMSMVSPFDVPAMGYATANTMPPPPIMSSPQDPTFNPDAVQNTNIIRLSKNYGQKTRLNVSGKMDGPIDFRGIASEVGLNNGYIANIQGSFNYMGSDIIGPNQFEQFVANKMGSSF